MSPDVVLLDIDLLWRGGTARTMRYEGYHRSTI